MAQHPSLKSQKKGQMHRSVLKRYERIKVLKDKEKWKDGDSVFGLLKLKLLKFKLKKEKAAPAAGAAEGAAEGVAAQAPAVAGAKKEATGSVAPKKEEKKK